jgi:hypothetical protein
MFILGAILMCVFNVAVLGKKRILGGGVLLMNEANER